MSWLSSLGLRTRLAVGMVALAVFAVGLATLLSNQGLDPRLTTAAKARIARSTSQLAVIAADDYRHHGGWTTPDTADLERLADTNGLRMSVVAADGRVLALPDHARPEPGDVPIARAPVVVNGRTVGSILVRANPSQLLTQEDVGLRRSLDSLHLLAGAISVVAALFIAFLLAHTLTTPLRRARLAAEGIARGDLDIRITPAGGAELRALGDALNRLAETLQDEEKLRKASVADLAHELRTPVGGLLSRIEAAQDHILPDEAANLNAMHAEAMRLTRLLDELSRLADAERPGLLVAKVPVDLATCAAQQVDAFRALAMQRGVSLHAVLPSAWISGDADRVGQIIANLISNAIRYTPGGGHADVLTRVDGDQAVLEVRDDGLGIAEADIPHIFKRFWRAEKSRSRDTGGAGIGLAIVRELVEAHDGTIEVESALGEGSTFRIGFQAIKPPKAAEPATGGKPAIRDHRRPAPALSHAAVTAPASGDQIHGITASEGSARERPQPTNRPGGSA